MIITIITPTYNRKDLIGHLYESIKNQRYDHIEWIIIDDGGTDHTEETVRGFEKTPGFRIRYVRQDNSGKPKAVNVGLDLVTGDLVCIIDDDDYLLPGVFATVALDFEKIRGDIDMVGLSYLSVDNYGKVWGRGFPVDGMVSDHFECRINRNIFGDKLEFTKAEVIKNKTVRYFDGTGLRGFGGDTIFFLEVAKHGRTLYRNMPVLVKVYRMDGYSINWRKRALENPTLTARYYGVHLDERVRFVIRFRYMVAYLAIAMFANLELDPIYTASRSNRVLLFLAYLPARIIAARWRLYKGRNYPMAKHWLR